MLLDIDEDNAAHIGAIAIRVGLGKSTQCDRDTMTDIYWGCIFASIGVGALSTVQVARSGYGKDG